MNMEFCCLATLSLTVGGCDSECPIISQANVRDVQLVNLLLNIFYNFSVFSVFNFLSIFSPELMESQV
jgi:hypothetical protein